MDNLKIYAVVVAYNGMQWYDKCFGSLQASSVPVHTIVIDNASGDNTVAYIKEQFPDVHIIESKTNLGFAKANNIGIKYAMDNNADYVFLLNQDAWIFEDTINLMLKSVSCKNKIGIISPMHLNGTEDNLDWKFSTNMSGDFISDAYLNKLKLSYPIPYSNAAAWLINKQCIQEVGGFDTSLFVHYGEDIDYCHRIHYFGYSFIINTQAKICHDRQFRRNIEEEYKRSVFKRDSDAHRKKLEYGNINNDIDIDKLLVNNKKIILRLMITFRFNKIKKIQQTNDLLKLIKKSRDINKRGNMPWL